MNVERKRMSKVSIKTIAEDLNLSRNTVSKALNNSGAVAVETRQRVIQRAAEMGYGKLEPLLKDQFAGNSEKNRKSIILFAHRDVSSFWDEIVFGIFDKLGQENYNILYNFISNEDEENGVMPVNILNDEVNGIILLDVFKREYVQKMLKRKLPIVFLDEPVRKYSGQPVGDCLLIEGFNSVYELTESLIRSGKSKIGFIGDTTYCRTIYDRYNGFLQAMIANDIPVNKEICLVGHTPQRYYDFSEVSIRLDNIAIQPDAFVCCNDDIAVWVMNYYKKRGCSIPDDIAICGFDNKKEYTVMEPSLTTVEIKKNDLGCRLAQEILWRIENINMPFETVVVNTKIKFGDSFPKPPENI